MVYFYELKKLESIEYGVQMTHFSNFLTKILVKLVEKLAIFTMMYFYELKEMQSIEYGVKMTDFSND